MTKADCAPGVACLGVGGGFCTDSCTPIPDSCGAGAACSLSSQQLDCVPRTFAPASSSPVPSDCSEDTECPAGTICSTNVGCERWCRMGKAADCAGGTVCVALPGPITADGERYGVCRAACTPGESCGNGGTCTIIGSAMTGDGPFVDCVPAASIYASTPCAASTCAAGTACRTYSASQAQCEAYCAMPGGSCSAGSVCTSLRAPIVAEGTTYGTCTTTCDPLSTASCGTATACNIVLAPGGPITDCVQAGTGVGPFGCSGQSCVPGAQCTEFADGLSACETYCRVGMQDCSTGFACAPFNPPVNLGGVVYGLCQDTCNLVTPSDVCGPNGACIPVTDGTTPPHTACAGYPDPTTPSGTFLLGAACNSDATCPPGATCTQGTCAAWCELGASAHCPGGTTCVAVSPSLVITGISYGTCG